jgi:probable HAF family extracellular repeat protein
MKPLITIAVCSVCYACGVGEQDPPPAAQPPPAPATSAAAYQLVELPLTGVVSGVNDQSTAVGTYAAGGGWMYEEDSSTLVSLSNSLTATAISDDGTITGADDNDQAAFWTTSGGFELLTGQWPASVSTAVANSTTIVGNYSESGYPEQVAVEWSGDGLGQSELAQPACGAECRALTVVSSVNSNGDAAGQLSDDSDCNGAAVWQAGQVTCIGPAASTANGINESDQVVGQADGYAFSWSNGTLTNLGALPGDSTSQANAVNNSGQIVGRSGARAFVYQNGQMTDLNSLIAPPASGIELTSATAISSNGWIAADGTDSQGTQRAFLLIPVIDSNVD